MPPRSASNRGGSMRGRGAPSAHMSRGTFRGRGAHRGVVQAGVFVPVGLTNSGALNKTIGVKSLHGYGTAGKQFVVLPNSCGVGNIPLKSPINDLPTEVLCKIFLTCISPSAGSTISISHRPCTAIVISHVCSRWRSVALEFPSLWSYITLDLRDALWADVREIAWVVHVHLTRSREVDLTLRMVGEQFYMWRHTDYADLRVLRECVRPSLGRIRHLDLAGTITWMNSFFLFPPRDSLPATRGRWWINNDFSLIPPSDLLPDGAEGSETLESLESIKLMYYPTRHSYNITPVRIFTRAPSLRRVEVSCTSDKTWKYLLIDTLNLPWEQITHLSLIHVMAGVEYIRAILAQCTALEDFTLSLILDERLENHGNGQWNGLAQVLTPTAPGGPIPTPVMRGHLKLPSVTRLTLYNVKHFDYASYLFNSLRIEFPSLQHVSFVFDATMAMAVTAMISTMDITPEPSVDASVSDTDDREETKLGGVVTVDLLLPRLSARTHGRILSDDIERLMGEHPSLVDLDVFQGQPLSAMTVRLMMQGYIAPKMEVLRCCVRRKDIGRFLDMVEIRWVVRKKDLAEGIVYRGFRRVVVRCVGVDEDGATSEEEECDWKECVERIGEFQKAGRDVTVVPMDKASLRGAFE
ncbi:hypothetical protein H0H92_010433 [Tricholoma furcatifolium]|nr:hypothetical protein H0H92_010433 [Tricholoma furcatifolium]